MATVAVVDGVVLKEGDKVKTFRGEEATYVECCQRGRNRVYCKTPGAKYNNEWFPSVIGATLEDRD